MNRNVLIAPSVLSADFCKMGEEINKMEKAGADVVHCDVMDGVFVPNISFGIKMIADIHKCTNLFIDAHLMIVNPEKYVEKFVEAGADLISVHYEACKENLIDVLKLIKSFNVKCGLVINPDTPVSLVEKEIPMCDVVLLMSVFPGFGGQKFIESVIPKISQVKKIIDACGKPIDIEIDGGINEENVKLVKEAGANFIVAGSSVFKSDNMAETIRKLRNN